jgi:predicted polyphosphate/ATP-dependent NAD kinase
LTDTAHDGGGDGRKRVAVLINPIAGLGGTVGLKGTDGPGTSDLALSMGASPMAEDRATRALMRLAERTKRDRPILLTGPGIMGESAARRASFDPVPLPVPTSSPTTPLDTWRSASEAVRFRAHVLLFAGGDGTARDIADCVGMTIPAIGIPAGVKMLSGVFAVSPSAAGDAAATFLDRPSIDRCSEAEVFDLNEEAYRQGEVRPRLFGYLLTPHAPSFVQSKKAPSAPTEHAGQAAIARYVAESIDPGDPYILGPGTTTRAIAEALGVGKTLVGIDVVRAGRLVARDASEADLKRVAIGGRAWIVVTPTGGQGFLLGRGNQPLSPSVLRAVKRERILVVATPWKLASLQGRPLLVDTGDEETDRLLEGQIRVVTGYREQATYLVRRPG